VEMAELATAQTELDAAEAVRPGLHAGPRTHDLRDPLSRNTVPLAHQLVPVLDL
jgi:hypothetical protein